MSYSRISIAAALLAVGALFVAPAWAGGKNGGGGGCRSNCGGGGGGTFESRIVCIINGRRFETNNIWKCQPKRQVVVRDHSERDVKIKHKHIRKLPVCGCAHTQGGYGGYAASYSGGGHYSGYATGGSTAARMQAERRSSSVAMTDGGVYFGQDGGGYVQHRSHLKKRRYFGGYEAGYIYDPGYVVHYGPTISKDGGY